MSSKCISCQQSVRPRQEGLQCDGCLRWQHRKCGTGIGQSDYRNAVNNGASIDWRCLTCDLAEPIPLAESTPVNFGDFESIVYDPPSASDLPADPVEPFAGDNDPPSASDLPDPVEDAVLDESSIAEPPAGENDPPSSAFEVTFQIISDSTSKGKAKLIDNRGFSYGVKRRRANATDWVCTRRPKVNIVFLAMIYYINLFNSND